MCRTIKVAAMMLAQLVSVALTASVKATDTKSVSSFNHFLHEKVPMKRVPVPVLMKRVANISSDTKSGSASSNEKSASTWADLRS